MIAAKLVSEAVNVFSFLLYIFNGSNIIHLKSHMFSRNMSVTTSIYKNINNYKTNFLTNSVLSITSGDLVSNRTQSLESCLASQPTVAKLPNLIPSFIDVFHS